MNELELKESLMELDTLLELINKKYERVEAECELLKRTMKRVEKIIEEKAN